MRATPDAPRILTNRGFPPISHVRGLAPALAVTIVVITAAAVARSHAQEPSILPALLDEVRGLRVAMERMASAGPRVQLALGRVQLQEQRVNTLVSRLQTVRDRLASVQRSAAEQQNQMERMEGELKSTPNQADRDQLEHVMGMFKSQQAAAAAEILRLTAEEAAIASDIASEQARWTDFNQRLEELERALGGR